MSAITGRGRRGNTVVPNFRWEDPNLDTYQLRIAGWLASHADAYLAKNVTRNEIARCTGISAGKVSSSLQKLEELGIIEVSSIEIPQSQGGHRLQIVFDFEAWETEPRSSGDQAPGHVVTTPGHVVTSTIGKQLEEQVSPSPLSAIEAETRKQQAQRIVTAWWDWKKLNTGKAPIANFPGTVKIVHKVLESGYEESDVKRALATLDAVSYASISRALGSATPNQSKNEKTMSVLERMAKGQIGVSA
jgi:DNA-binding Lrp family transcriptional regulator